MEKIKFHPAARTELRAAVLFYEECRPGLGREFLTAIDEALECLCAHPRMSRTIKTPYRRMLVRHFPYGIMYRESGENILVMAIMHLKRKPNYWHSRKTLS